MIIDLTCFDKGLGSQIIICEILRPTMVRKGTDDDGSVCLRVHAHVILRPFMHQRMTKNCSNGVASVGIDPSKRSQEFPYTKNDGRIGATMRELIKDTLRYREAKQLG